MTQQEFEIRSQQCRPVMFRIAYAILADREEAADAVQDALLKLWCSRSVLDTVGSLPSYFNIAVRNAALDIAGRRQAAVQAIDTETDRHIVNPTCSGAESMTDAALVMRAIDSLPPNSRQVMRLSIMTDMSSKEIADLMGLTDANVRAILSRTRKKLKELFT